MSHSGSDFYKPFIFVLGALVLLTIFLLLVANTLSPDSPDDPLAVAEMKRSISPVGKSRVVESAQPVESTAVATDAAADATGSTESTTAKVMTSDTDETETTATVDNSSAGNESAGSAPVAASMKVKAAVATNCAGCHNDGLHGAAKTDDAAAWAALAETGVDQLTASVINGKDKMPARAESTLNDDEIRQAVELMIANATGNATPVAASSAGAASAAVTATTQAANTAEAAPAPANEIPAAVKQVVDTACAACHVAGIAGAPKFGDKEAWAPRIAKGLDALVATSIAGIGVMPPRGGSTLDDEQMALAVEYMLSK